MQEVCEVGPKNLQNNFWVEELFLARNISRYFPVQKKFSYATPKPNNFQQLF